MPFISRSKSKSSLDSNTESLDDFDKFPTPTPTYRVVYAKPDVLSFDGKLLPRPASMQLKQPKEPEKIVTFHKFPEFPCEIRTQIWEAASIIPTDEHIVASFQGRPFHRQFPYKGEYYTQMTYRYRLSHGDGYHALGTLGASSESREAALKQNPDFLQLHDGPKLYFHAQRNIIHLDLCSLWNINRYVTDDIKGESRGRDANGVLWVNYLDKAKILRRQRAMIGFGAVERLSIPRSIFYVSNMLLGVFHEYLTVFTNVKRVDPRSMPRTVDESSTWSISMMRGIIETTGGEETHGLEFQSADPICWREAQPGPRTSKLIERVDFLLFGIQVGPTEGVPHDRFGAQPQPQHS